MNDDEISKIIAEELLLTENPDIIQEEIDDDIWKRCRGNPWNAVPLYRILQIVKK